MLLQKAKIRKEVEAVQEKAAAELGDLEGEEDVVVTEILKCQERHFKAGNFLVGYPK